MRPGCYNRPPIPEGQWWPTQRMKRMPTGRRVLGVEVMSDPKPVMRWRYSAFEDRCTQHDGAGIGPRNESYAKAHGFDCAGCRWEPERVRQARLFEERMRALPVDKAVDNGKVIHISTPSGVMPSFYARFAGELKRACLEPISLGERTLKYLQNIQIDMTADARMRRAWGVDLVDDCPELLRDIPNARNGWDYYANFSATPEDKL